MTRPEPDRLGDVVDVLREWQAEESAVQLHPGDLGWYWRFGVERTAAALRVWSRDGRIVAAGLLDEVDYIRIALEPGCFTDEALARQVVEDVSDPARGVLGESKVYVDVPLGVRIQELLFKDGWNADDPWQPLSCDLSKEVPDPGVRFEVVGTELASVRAAIQRASFDGSTFTDERWHTMAAGPLYADARCLLAYNPSGDPVAAVTVWSAGPGKPGYLEPMGVHRNHRGHGYGRAIVLAAAATLRDLGASTVEVATPASNVGAVATYQSATFVPRPEIRAQHRSA